MLRFADGRSFARGSCPYVDHLGGETKSTPRIFIPVEIEGRLFMAVVDTGGVWFVCDPEIAEALVPDTAQPKESLGIRDRTYEGDLRRLSLVLKAQEGESVALEVTAFLPRLRPGETWNLPPFLGLRGCLERLRFAVDPESGTFYFGALSEDGE